MIHKILNPRNYLETIKNNSKIISKKADEKADGDI